MEATLCFPAVLIELITSNVHGNEQFMNIVLLSVKSPREVLCMYAKHISYFWPFGTQHTTLSYTALTIIIMKNHSV